MCVFVYQKVGVYFPVDIGHMQTYGSLSVKLMSVDLVSHSDIVIRDFVLSLNRKQVSNEKALLEFRPPPTTENVKNVGSHSCEKLSEKMIWDLDQGFVSTRHYHRVLYCKKLKDAT